MSFLPHKWPKRFAYTQQLTYSVIPWWNCKTKTNPKHHQPFWKHNGQKMPMFLNKLKTKLIGQHNGQKTPIHKILYQNHSNEIHINEIGGRWKTQFFWVGHFGFLFDWIFLLHFYLNKSQINGVAWMGLNFMITMISRKIRGL